jgi:hypothetical protein
MGALLARKKDVSSQLQRREESPLQTLAASTAYLREQQARRSSAPKPKLTDKPDAGTKPPPTREGTTTTSRLLDMKRKRQQEGEGEGEG